jgi:hypothetical protein
LITGYKYTFFKIVFKRCHFGTVDRAAVCFAGIKIIAGKDIQVVMASLFIRIHFYKLSEALQLVAEPFWR